MSTSSAQAKVTEALEPAVRPAAYVPPKDACDCHAHVVGPFDRFPLLGPRKTAAAPLEAYLAMHELLGLDRGVITQPSHYGVDNACLLDALARTGGTVKGIVALDAADMNPAEIARLDKLGVRGVRISSVAVVGPTIANFDEVAGKLSGSDWHIEIMPPDSLAPLVAMRPQFERSGVPVMLDQMGCPDITLGTDGEEFQALLSMVRDGVVAVKLSHPYHLGDFPYAGVLPFAQALVAANPKQCVWATDWPHPRAQAYKAVPDDAFLLDLFAEWVPDETMRRQILVDNAARLYRF